MFFHLLPGFCARRFGFSRGSRAACWTSVHADLVFPAGRVLPAGLLCTRIWFFPRDACYLPGFCARRFVFSRGARAACRVAVHAVLVFPAGRVLPAGLLCTQIWFFPQDACYLPGCCARRFGFSRRMRATCRASMHADLVFPAGCVQPADLLCTRFWFFPRDACYSKYFLILFSTSLISSG